MGLFEVGEWVETDLKGYRTTQNLRNVIQ